MFVKALALALVMIMIMIMIIFLIIIIIIQYFAINYSKPNGNHFNYLI